MGENDQSGGVKVLGAGISKTGTSSLTEALKILGYTCIHYDSKRLNDLILGGPYPKSFRRYDDVDAVTDLPTAMFYREMVEAYPDVKVILTVRDFNGWWESMISHYERYEPSFWEVKLPHVNFVKEVRQLMWGSHKPHKYIYQKRYFEHNEAVQRYVPDCLVMNIVNGDGWEKLCKFLGHEIPDKAFPHKNRRTNVKHFLKKVIS